MRSWTSAAADTELERLPTKNLPSYVLGPYVTYIFGYLVEVDKEP